MSDKKRYLVLVNHHFGLLRKNLFKDMVVEIEGSSIFIDGVKVADDYSKNWVKYIESSIPKQWVKSLTEDSVVKKEAITTPPIVEVKEGLYKDESIKLISEVIPQPQKVEEELVVEDEEINSEEDESSFEDFNFVENSLEREKWDTLHWTKKKAFLETEKWSLDNLRKVQEWERRGSKISNQVSAMVRIQAGG